jgi:hypothetical protein
MDAHRSECFISYYSERHDVGILQTDSGGARGDRPDGPLAKAFKEAVAQQRTQDALRMVYRGIQLGLWPWSPGKITAYTEPDFASFGYKLTFTNELLPNLPFVTLPDDLRYDPEDLAYKIADEAFHFYRNRPTLPVDDHIVLGEE